MMQRSILCVVILGFSIVFASSVIRADEVDELHERAKALQKKALVSAEQGNKDEAARLKKEAAELLAAAKQLQSGAKKQADNKEKAKPEKGIAKEAAAEKKQPAAEHEQVMRKHKEFLHQLLEKQRAGASKQELVEMRERIRVAERVLAQQHAHHGAPVKGHPESHAVAEKLEHASRRVQHMRVAAENLKMAEMHDLAHEIQKKAEVMERDVQAAKERLADERHALGGGEHGPDVVRELRAEVARLRAEIKKLRQ